VMLLYIAVALGRFPRNSDWRDLLVHSRWAARGVHCMFYQCWGRLGPACIQPHAFFYQTPPRLPSIPSRRAALGLGGVLIVAAAVLGALGLCSWAGMRSTLIIAEVIPFLALAGGWAVCLCAGCRG